MGSHPYIALPRATTELRLNRVRSEREASQPPLVAAETRPARSKSRRSKIVTSEITDHHITVAGETRGLQQAGIVALRAEWRRLFGSEPPRVSRDLLVRALAYRVQEQSLGGLSRASLKRLRELAVNPQGREPPPDPAASLRSGARLVREWHGRTHVVVVTNTGFDYAGLSYGSLTQIAKLITGAHWSGPRFFGLTNGQPTRECADG
jgi:Protein of unknown function (DUF2924)